MGWILVGACGWGQVRVGSRLVGGDMLEFGQRLWMGIGNGMGQAWGLIRGCAAFVSWYR